MRTQLSIVICILCICIGCEKREEEYGVTYRPSDFPEILIAPGGATNIRYSSPGTGKIVKGAYSLSYTLIDEYPAEKTIEWIRNHLQSQGCVRVEWTPDDFIVHDVEGDKAVGNDQATQEFRKSLKEKDWPSETQWQKPEPLADYAEIIYSTWHEERITREDDLISIILQYSTPQDEEKIDQLYVNLTAFTPSSWRYSYVKKYKERHPEIFSQITDPNSR